MTVAARLKTSSWSLPAYLLLAGIAYWPLLSRGQFLCDDFILLERVKHGIGLWDTHGADFYRPAISTALSVLWRLFGANAVPYHWFNVLLLVGTGLFAQGAWHALTCEDSEPRRTDWPAFTAGALFVTWATHSESVSWISGMTDGVAIFFAAASLYMYALYLRRPSWWMFLLAILLLWLGLLGKEAVASFVPIFMILGIALYGKRGHWRLRIAEVAGLALVGIAYLAWRTHVIGQLIGGYGAKVHLNFSPTQFYTKVAKHLANAFLPFNREVALREGYNLATILTAVVCVGAVTLLLRRLPKKAETPRWVHGVTGLLCIVGAIWVGWQFIPDFAMEEYGPRIWIAVAAVLVVCAAGLWRSKRSIRFDTPRGFIFVSLLTLAVHANILPGRNEWHIVLFFLGFAYLTRPIRETSNQEMLLIKLGLACIVSTFLAIGPTATLRIDFSGEGSRFSYSPSLFGGFTLLCLALIYLKDARMRIGLTAASLTVSTLLLVSYNQAWGAASDISGETTRVIKGLLPARRIYALSAPGTITAASLFRIGLEFLPDVTLNDSKAEIHPGTFLAAGREGDWIKAWQVGPSTFDMSLKGEPGGFRAYVPFIEPADPSYTKGWFLPPPAGSAALKLDGYDPAVDRVIVIDCRSVTVLH